MWQVVCVQIALIAAMTVLVCAGHPWWAVWTCVLLVASGETVERLRKQEKREKR